MKEYIERGELESILHNRYEKLAGLRPDFYAGYSMAFHTIQDEVPTAADVVEVVQCKDCRHFTEGMAIGMCKRNPDNPIIPMPYNNYCGFGERRNK